MEENKKNSIFGILIVIILIFIIGIISAYISINKAKNKNKIEDDKKEEKYNFTYSLIKNSNNNIGKDNYMISPYSIEIALSMLRDGTANKSYDELNKVVPKRDIMDLSIKDKISIANGVFIKDIYKDSVLPSYYELLSKEYKSELIYDPFKIPDKINKWVDEKTNHMIPSVVDDISEDFVMGVANAVSMELDWKDSFMCENTKKDTFKLKDNSTMDVFMMNKTYESDASYYKNKDFSSVIIPYKSYDKETGEEKDNGESIEFIGIIPKNIDSFINTLDEDLIKKIDKNKKTASDKLSISVGLPRFNFDYDFKKFQSTLNKLGIKEIFSDRADFSNMINESIYVSKSVHKSHIEVDEKGTKASAVTYFGMDKNSASIDKEYFNIKFNKPFVFIIKDSDSNEILFFGVVYEPIKYNDFELDC